MENEEEIDVNALLASINSNLEEGLSFPVEPVTKLDDSKIEEIKLDNQNKLLNNEEKQENTDANVNLGDNINSSIQEKGKSPEFKKSNVFTIVREKAEEIEEDNEFLKLLDKIKIVNSLLSSEECNSFTIDTNKIQENYEAIMKKYDAKLTKITENQKKIFEMNNKVKTLTGNFYYGKDMAYLKTKNSTKDSKIKEIKTLDLEAEKSKIYLLAIIHRLESLEFGLDKLIDYNLKIKKQ